MSDLSAFILAPWAGLLVYALGHWAAVRFKLHGNLRAIVVTFFPGLAATLFFTPRAGFEPVHDIVFNGAFFCLLGFIYFHFINLGATSRRTRILIELWDAGPEGLTRAQLRQRYNAGEMLDRRLRRLVDAGQVVRRGGRLYPGKATMLWMARLVSWAGRLVLGR